MHNHASINSIIAKTKAFNVIHLCMLSACFSYSCYQENIIVSVSELATATINIRAMMFVNSKCNCYM